MTIFTEVVYWPASAMIQPACVHVLRWMLRCLVNAILRPPFVAYRRALREGRISAAVRGELRFLKLLNSTDCYPFCVTVDSWGLWITDEAPEYDEGDWS